MNDRPSRRMPALPALLLQMFPEIGGSLRKLIPEPVLVPAARAVPSIFVDTETTTRIPQAMRDELYAATHPRDPTTLDSLALAPKFDPHSFNGWKSGGVNGFGRASTGGRGASPTRTQKLKARKAQRQARTKQRRR